MASSKRLITVFGSTGNQGGSVISTALDNKDLASKYAFRGVTRDPSSSKSKALAAKGVEMVKAEMSDPASVKDAIKGSWGVFGVTDFWSLLDKEKEFQQGKAIVDASKEAGVKHIVLSTLPSVEKLSGGSLKDVKHFDSKAMIKDYAETNKGTMVASYYEPAFFYSNLKSFVNSVDGVPTLALPFEDENADWPMHDPVKDGGKWVMGLFEGGDKADGVSAQAASSWTTAKEVVSELSKATGKEVLFKPVSTEVYASFFPANIANELTEMMVWIGEYNYYGKDAKGKQAESDKWAIEPAVDLKTYIKDNGPWEF